MILIGKEEIDEGGVNNYDRGFWGGLLLFAPVFVSSGSEPVPFSVPWWQQRCLRSFSGLGVHMGASSLQPVSRLEGFMAYLKTVPKVFCILWLVEE